MSKFKLNHAFVQDIDDKVYHGRDIQAYFDDRKGYGLEFEQVKPVSADQNRESSKKQFDKRRFGSNTLSSGRQ